MPYDASLTPDYSLCAVRDGNIRNPQHPQRFFIVGNNRFGSYNYRGPGSTGKFRSNKQST